MVMWLERMMSDKDIIELIDDYKEVGRRNT